MITATLIWHSIPFLLEGTFVTMQIACLAIAVGLLGGILIGVANCRHLALPGLSLILNGFVWIVRGTPLFVQVFLMYYAVPEILGTSFTPFGAGVAALGFNSMAYVSEIVRGGMDGIPVGQWEAAYALGLPLWKTLKGIILPQMFRLALPGLTNELVALVKQSSILMIIGVAELTKVSKDIVARELNPIVIYLEAAVFYLIMTSLLSWAAHSMKRRWAL
jgi:His/Glu/Gln/Arg/opine family amino acid ABC transporter permease subunit